MHTPCRRGGCSAGTKGFAGRFLELRPMIAVGRISYVALTMPWPALPERPLLKARSLKVGPAKLLIASS